MSDSFDLGDLTLGGGDQGTPPTVDQPSAPAQPPPESPPQTGGAGDVTYGGGMNFQPSSFQAPTVTPDTSGMTLTAPTAPDQPAPQQQGFLGGITDWLSQPSNLVKLGLGAGGLGLGLASSNAAQKQGAAAQSQIAGIPANLQQLSQATQDQLKGLATQYQAMVNNASSAIAGMSAPLMQQYTSLINTTNQGQLTPANKQIMDAARARLAQDAANKGGVGAEQAQSQLDRLQNTLLASQMQQALQLYQTASPAQVTAQQTQLAGTNAANQYLTSGMQTALSTAGLQDQYALQAIQTGLQQDNQARTSMSNFYSALANIMAGVPTKQATA